MKDTFCNKYGGCFFAKIEMSDMVAFRPSIGYNDFGKTI